MLLWVVAEGFTRPNADWGDVLSGIGHGLPYTIPLGALLGGVIVALVRAGPVARGALAGALALSLAWLVFWVVLGSLPSDNSDWFSLLVLMAFGLLFVVPLGALLGAIIVVLARALRRRRLGKLATPLPRSSE